MDAIISFDPGLAEWIIFVILMAIIAGLLAIEIWGK